MRLARRQNAYLDVDNVTANGPEHYFASYDSTILAPGEYCIGINNHARAHRKFPMSR
jgi:hypothetical protein